MSNIPTQDIIDNHRMYVSMLISMKEEDSEQARNIRVRVRDGNCRYHELELIYIQMMEESGGTGDEGCL